MHSRRDFIKSAIATAAAISICPVVLSKNIKANKRKGILLGTLQKEMTSDPAETLKYLSELGYQTLEYPNNYGHDAKKLGKIIKSFKLISIGGGDSISNLKKNFSSMVKEYHIMGKEYVMCYWPWMDGGKDKSLDDWKKNAEVFNALGKEYKKEGLRLAYHNHDMEYVTMGNTTPYDILLKNTDPAYLTFEIDLWWIVKGKKNPSEYLINYPGRFELCHIKTADVFGNTEIVADYDTLLPLAEVAGCKHFIIENEIAISSPMEYAKRSIEYLNVKLKQ